MHYRLKLLMTENNSGDENDVVMQLYSKVLALQEEKEQE